MRRFVACSTLAALLAVAVSSSQCDAHPPVSYRQDPPHEEPWFSCDGGCTSVLTDAIGLARKSILVEGYRIGPRPVLSTLKQAEAAGVDVRTVLERGRARYAGAPPAQDSAGGRRDPNYAVDRPELVVIDNRQVIEVFFGSSPDHARNIEGLLAIRDRDLALAYTDDSSALGR